MDIMRGQASRQGPWIQYGSAFWNKMSSPASVRLLGLALLLLFLLAQLTSPVSSMALNLCGMSDDCRSANVDIVHPYIAEVCEACGNFWDNVPDFAYCCRCDNNIFDFCMQAVLGGRR